MKQRFTEHPNLSIVNTMGLIATLSAMFGSSFLSGFSAYATVGFLGLFGRLGWLNLPEGLKVLENPTIFGIALALFVVEFVADKVPAFDSFWDSIQTFIRIPTGAVLAYAAVGDVSPELKFGAVLLGGTVAFSAHASKSTVRALANMSPEPISNWLLSLGQDTLILLGVFLIFYLPLLMLMIIALFFVAFLFFLPKIFRTFRWVFRKFMGLFRTPSHT